MERKCQNVLSPCVFDKTGETRSEISVTSLYIYGKINSVNRNALVIHIYFTLGIDRVFVLLTLSFLNIGSPGRWSYVQSHNLCALTSFNKEDHGHYTV